jgi:NADH-quinone oxidoreductase subunit L
MRRRWLRPVSSWFAYVALFELSDTALSFILVIGSITALFMGFLGIIQNDIKRVVAYSTLSQLGYMTVALGASAYSVAVFHLMTHAFLKHCYSLVQVPSS